MYTHPAPVDYEVYIVTKHFPKKESVDGRVQP